MSEQPAAPFEDTTGSAPRRRRVSLFWRTFFILATLLFASIVAWLQILQAIEFAPHVVQSARQISALVSLSRTALLSSDAGARARMIEALADGEHVQVLRGAPQRGCKPKAQCDACRAHPKAGRPWRRPQVSLVAARGFPGAATHQHPRPPL